MPDQQLVIEYNEGDGYTYSCTTTLPLYYSSAEAALVDIENHVKDYLNKVQNRLERHPNPEFKLGRLALNAGDFYYYDTKSKEYVLYLPEIYTIEEWFNAHYHN